MEDCFKAKETHTVHIPSFFQVTDDTNFKLMVIWHAEETNNCSISKK